MPVLLRTARPLSTRLTHCHAQPPPPKTYPTSQFTQFEDAMDAFLESNELRTIKPQVRARTALPRACFNHACAHEPGAIPSTLFHARIRRLRRWLLRARWRTTAAP